MKNILDECCSRKRSAPALSRSKTMASWNGISIPALMRPLFLTRCLWRYSRKSSAAPKNHKITFAGPPTPTAPQRFPGYSARSIRWNFCGSWNRRNRLVAVYCSCYLHNTVFHRNQHNRGAQRTYLRCRYGLVCGGVDGGFGQGQRFPDQ